MGWSKRDIEVIVYAMKEIEVNHDHTNEFKAEATRVKDKMNDLLAYLERDKDV